MLIYFADKIVHATVPMFIFIAGYKYEMNNRNESYKEFFLKKYNSIFKPFLFVSTFYLIYYWGNVLGRRLILYKTVDMEFILHSIVKGFLRMFLGYNFAYQLWYIPMYLLIVLTYPIIVRYLKHDYIRLTFFVSLAIFWEIISNLKIPYIANNPYPLSFIYYFFLYEMGCLFYSKKLYQKSSRVITVLYFTLLFSMIIVKSTLLVRVLTNLVFNPVSVIFFYYVSAKLKDNKVLTILGNYSFYIYLFHEPLILSVTSRYLLNHNMYKSGLIAPALAILSIAVITVFSSFLTKPYVGKHRKNADVNHSI
jgi:peptidoglycan/LPS O-acetylase OafA/YrhL